MNDLSWFHSQEYGEDISYYPDDLNYSDTVMGVGYETGRAYNVTFDRNGLVTEIEPWED